MALPAVSSKDEDGLILVDPVDKKVIGFHYGETHGRGVYSWRFETWKV